MKIRSSVAKYSAVLVASSLVLTACGGGSNSNQASGENGGEAPVATYNPKGRDELKDGGTLTSAIGELSEQQNRFHSDETAYTTTLWNWYNPLTSSYTPEGEYMPNKAYFTEVKDETKNGKTVVTYTINEKATFNDGTPIDWRAIETTWYINNGKHEGFAPQATDGYQDIESVTKGANDKQAVVTFDRAYPWYKSLFDNIAHPALKEVNNYKDYVKKVHPEWGAGPFKVENVDFNKGTAVFVRNEKWWGDAPKLEKRVFRYMEAAAATNAFKNGEIDIASAADKSAYAQMKDMPDIDLRAGRVPRVSLSVFNSKSEILKDQKVREALAKGTDRETLSKIWFQGLPYSGQVAGSFTLMPYQEGYEDNFSAAGGFDKEKAQQLLDEAGWKAGDDGIRTKDGKPLSLRYVQVGQSEQTDADAKAFQQMMRDIGVDLKVETHPGSEFSKIANARDFDIFPMAISFSDPYGVAFFGQTYMSDSELNKSGTGTPEFDAKIRELQKLPTEEEQIKRANELEKEILATFGIIPKFNYVSITAVKKGLANVGPMALGSTRLEDIGWEK